jgi:hypothetical protein
MLVKKFKVKAKRTPTKEELSLLNILSSADLQQNKLNGGSNSLFIVRLDESYARHLRHTQDWVASLSEITDGEPTLR